jgi:hypothetical protein
MAITINQTPATASLAQSPIVFSLGETGGVLFSSSFQYNADLYYWTGSVNDSGSYQYQMVKYPNQTGTGIFDFSRILNSTLPAPRAANPSNVKFFTADFYSSYISSSNGVANIVTGSRVRSNVYKILDGYALFDENITGSIISKTPYWPMMTDGPATQSFFDDNRGTIGVFAGGAGSTLLPTKIVYSDGATTAELTVTSSINAATSASIGQLPMFPSEAGFPITPVGDSYSLQAFFFSTPISAKLNFVNKCKQKYPNVRIKWKNRFGQYDYFNFDMVSRTGFKTTARTYQPQIGSFQSTTLTYQDYETSNQKYIVDSEQTLQVNTDWVSEDYNDIFKQLLVSEEVYWVQDETNGVLTPITINTESITFKTGVVDKTIQYSFEFLYGKAYKLIL